MTDVEKRPTMRRPDTKAGDDLLEKMENVDSKHVEKKIRSLSRHLPSYVRAGDRARGAGGLRNDGSAQLSSAVLRKRTSGWWTVSQRLDSIA